VGPARPPPPLCPRERGETETSPGFRLVSRVIRVIRAKPYCPNGTGRRSFLPPRSIEISPDHPDQTVLASFLRATPTWRASLRAGPTLAFGDGERPPPVEGSPGPRGRPSSGRETGRSAREPPSTPHGSTARSWLIGEPADSADARLRQEGRGHFARHLSAHVLGLTWINMDWAPLRDSGVALLVTRPSRASRRCTS
jgi:hypothetical protein